MMTMVTMMTFVNIIEELLKIESDRLSSGEDYNFDDQHDDVDVDTIFPDL